MVVYKVIQTYVGLAGRYEVESYIKGKTKASIEKKAWRRVGNRDLENMVMVYMSPDCFDYNSARVES
jgi:hypothetical protein